MDGRRITPTLTLEKITQNIRHGDNGQVNSPGRQKEEPVDQHEVPGHD